MTINQYFFNYRNTDFVIFARNVPEAFESYKRILFHKAKTLEEIDKIFLKDVPDIRKCLMLCGSSITRNEAENIRKSYRKPEIVKSEIHMTEKKSREYVAAPKEIAIALKESVPVSEEVALGTIKRGRGRPKGSKNKPKGSPQKISNNSIDSLFE